MRRLYTLAWLFALPSVVRSQCSDIIAVTTNWSGTAYYKYDNVSEAYDLYDCDNESTDTGTYYAWDSVSKYFDLYNDTILFTFDRDATCPEYANMPVTSDYDSDKQILNITAGCPVTCDVYCSTRFYDSFSNVTTSCANATNGEFCSEVAYTLNFTLGLSRRSIESCIPDEDDFGALDTHNGSYVYFKNETCPTTCCNDTYISVASTHNGSTAYYDVDSNFEYNGTASGPRWSSGT